MFNLEGKKREKKESLYYPLWSLPHGFGFLYGYSYQTVFMSSHFMADERTISAITHSAAKSPTRPHGNCHGTISCILHGYETRKGE